MVRKDDKRIFDTFLIGGGKMYEPLVEAVISVAGHSDWEIFDDQIESPLPGHIGNGYHKVIRFETEEDTVVFNLKYGVFYSIEHTWNSIMDLHLGRA